MPVEGAQIMFSTNYLKEEFNQTHDANYIFFTKIMKFEKKCMQI